MSGIPESWKSVAAELRARAEKARAEANRSTASDGLLYAGLMVEARTYDEAASLVEALRSPERVEGWGRYFARRQAERAASSSPSREDDESPAEGSTDRPLEDDEDGPCPSCEDGCERCDPRYLRDADIDTVSNLVAAHGNADHIAAMDRLVARAVSASPDRVAEGALCPTCKSDDPRYYCIPFIGKRHQGDPLVCDDSFHATAPTTLNGEDDG